MIKKTLARWFTFGKERTMYHEIPEGDEFSRFPRAKFSGKRQKTVDAWASRNLKSWKEQWKVTGPRICLARIENGSNSGEVDRFLKKEKPDRNMGSTWKFKKWFFNLGHKGDYDFTASAIVPLFFKDICEVAKENLLHHHLGELDTDPNAFRKTAPKSFGIVGETENHILMTEGTRYFKAKVLGKTKQMNEIGEKLSDFLDEIIECGVWEFNSEAYSAFTVMALMNLVEYGEEEIEEKSRRILDQMVWQFAVGCCEFKSYRPYRRKPRSFTFKNYFQQAMKVWAERAGIIGEANVWNNKSLTLWASVMDYSPPTEALELAANTSERYESRIGHGIHSSSESYSGGEGWLLSSGGTTLGVSVDLKCYPTTLITKKTKRPEEAFQLYGPTDKMENWNNTGVANGVAVVKNGFVDIPQRQDPVVKTDTFDVFEEPTGTGNSLSVAVFSDENLSLLYVSENLDPKETVEKLSIDIRTSYKGKVKGQEVVSFDLSVDQRTFPIEEKNQDIENWPHFRYDILQS